MNGLGPCPRCGKRDGKLVDSGQGRFRYYVTCGQCVFMTDVARTAGIAVKLWNEAKRASKAKLRTAATSKGVN